MSALFVLIRGKKGKADDSKLIKTVGGIDYGKH